jgi:hypothetical protein
LYHPILKSEKKYEDKCYSIENINKNITVGQRHQNWCCLKTKAHYQQTKPQTSNHTLTKMSDQYPRLTNNTIPAKNDHMTRKGNTLQQNKTK